MGQNMVFSLIEKLQESGLSELSGLQAKNGHVFLQDSYWE